MDRQRVEAYVDAAAAALDLPLAAEHRPGVLSYFTLAAELAESVLALPLGSADDPAPVFVPIGPDEGDARGAVPNGPGPDDAARGEPAWGEAARAEAAPAQPAAGNAVRDQAAPAEAPPGDALWP